MLTLSCLWHDLICSHLFVIQLTTPPHGTSFTEIHPERNIFTTEWEKKNKTINWEGESTRLVMNSCLDAKQVQIRLFLMCPKTSAVNLMISFGFNASLATFQHFERSSFLHEMESDQKGGVEGERCWLLTAAVHDGMCRLRREEPLGHSSPGGVPAPELALHHRKPSLRFTNLAGVGILYMMEEPHRARTW